MTQETFTLSGENFHLRKAVESDVVPIVELMVNDVLRRAENTATAEGHTQYLDAFHAIDADPAHLLVVVTDDAATVVATMQLTIIPGLARMGAARLLVEAVRVDEKLRGNGLGTAMMEWAIAEGQRRGASLVQLTSDKSREGAHRFYERLGFEPSHVGFKLFL
ncbi:GNAT family N-acetyltransferase [Paeniglutamicibacter sp. NPDC012692]|uniref:GNAT family N-acetyltransferase n=1 Tax=Paeniglutamicibacter sp. NPDC012692 TaxID=3364388 RepID=UPI00369B5161